MAFVRLRGPLKARAGHRAEHPLDGGTVLELLRELERAHPPLGGGSSTSAGPCGGTSTCS